MEAKCQSVINHRYGILLTEVLAAALLFIVLFYKVEGVLLIGFIGLASSAASGLLIPGTRLNMLANLLDCLVINFLLCMSLMLIITSHSIDKYSMQFSYPNAYVLFFVAFWILVVCVMQLLSFVSAYRLHVVSESTRLT